MTDGFSGTCPTCGQTGREAIEARDLEQAEAMRALLEAGERLRAAIGDRPLGDFGENGAVWAYDAAKRKAGR